MSKELDPDREPSPSAVEPYRFWTVQDLADDVVTEYTEREAPKAIARVESKKHGDGCQCANCIKFVVREGNRWIDWISVTEDEADYYRYHIIPGRKSKGLIIVQDADDIKKLEKLEEEARKNQKDENPPLALPGIKK